MLSLPGNNYSFLFEKLPGLTLILTPDCRVAAVSDAYLTATGSARKAIEGCDLFTVLPQAAGDKAAAANKIAHSLQHVLQHKQPHRIVEQQYLLPLSGNGTGERYWTQLNTPVLNDQQELICIIHHAEDISNRKKAEKKFNDLVEAAPDATVIINEQGFIHIVNKEAEKLFGYKREEMIGEPVEILIPHSLRKKHVHQRDRFIKAEEVRPMTASHALYAVKKDGTVFDAEVGLSPLHTEEGIFMSASIRDITLRKRAQEQLVVLSMQINQSNDAIYAVNKELKITSWNQGAVLLFGFSAAEALGNDPMQLLQTNEEKIKNALEKVAKENYWSGDLKRKRKDGSIIYVRTSISAVREENKTLTGYISVGFDITEQLKLQEQLGHLANLVEQSSEAIVSRGMDERLISWNKGAEKLLGFSKEEALGKTAVELGIIRLTAADMSFGEKELHEKGSFKHEVPHYRKDGTVFWGAVSGNAVKNGEGIITSVAFIIKDISLPRQLEEQLKRANSDLEEKVRVRTEEIAKSEKRFRALLENSNDIIVLLDDDFKTVYRSQAAQRITGWGDSEIINYSVSKNIHPDEFEKALAVLKEVKLNPGKPVYGKFRNKHKNGHYLWMEGVITNLLHDKNVNAIVFNSRDITARVENEEQLRLSEIRFRSLIENSTECITLTDADFNPFYRSPSAIKTIGEISLAELSATTHADDLEKMAAVRMKTLNNPGLPVPFTGRFLNHRRQYMWLEGTLTNLLHVKAVEAVVNNFRDITERKAAEFKTIQSEENLKAIFENASEGFILTDASGIVKAFNSKVTESIMLNVNKKIEAGKSIFDFTEGRGKTFFKQVFEKVMNGDSISYDRVYNYAPGPVTWINFTFTPVKEGSSIQGICITGRDITAEKLAAQQKEFDRSNLNALINNTTDMMWSVDRQFELITSNLVFDDLLQRVTGATPTAGFKVLREEFPDEQLSRYKTYYERAFAGETFKVTEHNHVPFKFSSETSFYPIYEGNQVIGTACFSRDVTERNKAEEALKKSYREKKALAGRMSAIINALPATIALLNEDGVIIEVNDAWRNFAQENKYTGPGYGIGINYVEVAQKAVAAGEPDGKKIAEGIKAVLKNKKKEFVYEYSCHSPETERWFRMITTAFKQETHAGAVVMHIDISELRKLEQFRLKSGMEEQKKITLAIMQGQEKERNYIGRELHDNINQILAGTKIFIGSACRKNEELKPLIKYPLELLDSAIEEIRLLSRNLVSPVKQADLKELCSGLLEDCKKHNVITTHFTYRVTDELLSDDLGLNIYRVLQELVNNMQKYAAAKTVSISLKTTGKLLTVVVTDDGKGFDVNIKREGIGIANMINRIESFDGNMQIISSPGQGCKTIITVPL